MDRKEWERLKADPFAPVFPKEDVRIPTEEDDGTEIVYYEDRLLEDGRTLRIPIPDTIITLTHPLTGQNYTAPMSLFGMIFSRVDFTIGHLQMKEHMEREMSKHEEEEGRE